MRRTASRRRRRRTRSRRQAACTLGRKGEGVSASVVAEVPMHACVAHTCHEQMNFARLAPHLRHPYMGRFWNDAIAPPHIVASMGSCKQGSQRRHSNVGLNVSLGAQGCGHKRGSDRDPVLGSPWTHVYLTCITTRLVLRAWPSPFRLAPAHARASSTRPCQDHVTSTGDVSVTSSLSRVIRPFQGLGERR